MKTLNWKAFVFASIITVSSIACGPTSVAVRTRPPAPVYVRPIAPSSAHIWVGDSYVWRGGHYVYQPGYWTTPRRGHVYVQGYWERNRRGDRWVPGHWR